MHICIFPFTQNKYQKVPARVAFLIALNSLTRYQMTNFRLFQTERVCRRQFQFWRKWHKLSKWVENTLGKGEIARYEQFLLFPQCFQKACFTGASKVVIVWEWVNKQQNFRLVQIDSICRRQHKLEWKIKTCFGKGRKHCGKRRQCWLFLCLSTICQILTLNDTRAPPPPTSLKF